MARRGKTGRGANGTGSIRKIQLTNKQGKTYEYWQGRVTVGYDSNGKQIQRSISAKTQSELVKKISEMSADVRNGTYLENNSITVSEWLNTWLSTYLNHVAQNTAHEYRQKLERYIIPALGEIKLQKLTNKNVQDCINRVLYAPKSAGGKGLSPKSIKDIYGVFHVALNKAVEIRIISSNPAENCSLPRVVSMNRPFYDISDIELFLEAIHGHCHEIYYKTLLFTGIREAEGLGLTWDCVDFTKNLIHIDKQLVRNRSTGEYFFAPPKDMEYRTLAVPESLMDLLRMQKFREAEKCKACGEFWEKKNLVFSNPTGGYLSYRTVYDCYKRIVRKIGLPEMRVHDLRHAYASLALDNGDDIKTLQENLGHATAAFSLKVYAYSSSSMKTASANRMNNRINELALKKHQ